MALKNVDFGHPTPALADAARDRSFLEEDWWHDARRLGRYYHPQR